MADTFCAKCGAQFRDGDVFCAKCGARRDGEGDGERWSSVPGKAGKQAGWIALTLAGVGVVCFIVFADACEHLKGRVAVTGGPQPAFTFTPTGCASMQPYGRFGANLHGHGPNDGGTYVTVDPLHGTTVDVEIPGSCRHADGTDCTLIHVPREKCRTWDAHVENSSTEVNDVRLVQGHLRLDCALDDGTHVVANVEFSGC